ncbi:hypothetical protein AXF42_Ash011147 [Apostasia shenzhenica]|uniref:Uncharacterized protein n=1 Tax=Apostasia shenzhenica TaxID=1088818 RepID=A0A2I0AKY1_9ASPA|nr:hypothetical protein AXF42_Ash011147 [Apostasia shenzhenica]
MDCVPLIDVSAEDDLLVPSSCQGSGSEISGPLASGNIEKTIMKLTEQVPEHSESPEHTRKRSDKYNLRKSLAWDSAFSSSEGFLKPEELAIMNSTFFRASGMALPGFHEESDKSSESCSTLGSECCALEDLEANLFKNVQTLIQKSLGNSNQASNVMHPNTPNKEKKSDVQPLRTLKKVGFSSQNKLRHPIALRSSDATSQQHENTSKDSHVRVKMPSRGNGDSKPSIRPPKVSSGLPPAIAPGKKMSSDEMVRIKCKSKKAFAGTFTSSTSTSSDSKPVPSLLSLRKRSADRCKTSIKPGRTGSTLGVPHPNLAKSTLVLSKVSPTSSIDSVASESSSSSSISVKFCNSLEDSNAGSSSTSVSISSSFGSSQNSGNVDGSKSYVKNDSSAKQAVPSGLRMPRPRSGFFDKTCSSKNTQIYEIAEANKLKLSNLPPSGAGAVLTLSNEASNCSEGRVDHRKPETFQELCLQVAKFTSLTPSAKLMNDPNAADITTEKENVAPCSGEGKLAEKISLFSGTEGGRDASATC